MLIAISVIVGLEGKWNIAYKTCSSNVRNQKRVRALYVFRNSHVIFLWNIFFWIPYIHSSICQKGHIQKHILVTVLLVSKLLPPSICSFCGYKKYDIFGHQGHSVFLTGSTDDDCQTSPSMVAFCFNFLFWQKVCDVLPVEQFARFFLAPWQITELIEILSILFTPLKYFMVLCLSFLVSQGTTLWWFRFWSQTLSSSSNVTKDWVQVREMGTFGKKCHFYNLWEL